MSDFAFMDPPIDVVAASPRLEMIVARLRAAGMRPSYASGDLVRPSGVPLFLDLETTPPQVMVQLTRLRLAETPRTVITLGEGKCSVKPFLHLESDADITALPNKLTSHRRRVLRDEEISQRVQAAADLGEEITHQIDGPLPDILYLGDGSAFFLALQSALRNTDINLTGTLSLTTACDHLEKKNFSAVLIDVDDAAPHGIQLLERAATDARVAGLPVYACVRDEDCLSRRAKAALSNASEIITAKGQTSSIAEQVCLLAHSRPSARPIAPQAKLNSKISDLATGLFSRAFFDLHLPRQMHSTAAREVPLTLLTLRLRSNDDDHSARGALPELAHIVKPVLRETDCAARIDSTTLAISMPDATYGNAVRMAERIIEKLGGEELGMVGTALPFGGSLGWRAVERRAYHDAERLLGAATTGPFARIRAA